MNEKTLRVLEFNKIKELLIDKCESRIGKEYAKKISPITNIKEIDLMQQETEEALSLLIKRGKPPLYGIHSISYEIKRVEIGGVLNPASLIKVSDSLRVSRGLKNYIKETKADKMPTYLIIGELIDNLRVYKNIEDEINNAIINENEISDNASSTLRNIRRQISSKNDAIRDKLNSIVNSQTNRKYLQDGIVTVREGRYVIPVKQENRSSVPGLIHDISSSGATVFIEPMAVVELNNQLRELEIKEQDEIERILSELSNLVASESDGIGNNEKILRTLDFVFAKGKLALEMNATRPILNDKGIINIKKARHPLLQTKVVVPIDVYIGRDFNSLIITGPNTGGKTVTLKTVGLFTLMAQAGLHIPADYNSEVAVFNQIFADIGDEQSIEQSLSTFSSHMTNIVNILKEVRYNSLILFDELGAGTDPTEGAALAMAILDYLLKKDIRTIATTHYSQLKLYALTTERVRNASVEFDVETLSPTYRLLIGVPGKSNAFEISKRLGLPQHIIDDAKELISKENVEFEDVLQAIEQDRKSIEEDKIEAKRLRLEIEQLRKGLATEKEKTQQMRDGIIRKAKEEARDILKNAKEEADLVVGEVRDISSEIEKEHNKRLLEAQELLRKDINKMESSLSKDIFKVKSNRPPKNLKIGETVEVLSLNQVGTVSTLPNEKGYLTVQIGIMKVNVHISALRRVASQDSDKSTIKAKTIIGSKSKSIKNEIDLRGKNIEEAILDIDKYLDDSYIANLKEVYLIHGKGTGALRDGIKSYLRGHKHVKSYRPGKYGEGGDGVTVVEIK
ncbi:endonuclease MutS2 [Paratissierella segnis]|uniref:Endonuclease MutS2 n=1 Tax=Paratissierella segnis TaxID=2763679 RepID=A0A926EZU7_9FIRM|nr:endonuclease MutS2 [Paratissierella segnis]MBC8589300.1 endonuclease MutS2 [Paratissierella segnis]